MEIHMLEGKFKDALLAMLLVEVYNKYGSYLYMNACNPNFEKLNGHKIKVTQIEIEKLKIPNEILNVIDINIIKNIVTMINSTADEEGILYINVIGKIVEKIRE